MKTDDYYEKVHLLPEQQGLTETRAEKSLAERAGIELADARDLLERWKSWGLFNICEEDEKIAVLIGADQLAEDPDAFNPRVLGFLADDIDDLWARRALVEGGCLQLNSLQVGCLNGDLTTVKAMLPEHFHAGLNEKDALDFLSAQVALMTNLSVGRPAGSWAEEICAMALMGYGESMLEFWQENYIIDGQQGRDARDQFPRLFDLFDDMDILRIFEQESEQDLPIPSEWFEPFWSLPQTGYMYPRIDRTITAAFAAI